MAKKGGRDTFARTLSPEMEVAHATLKRETTANAVNSRSSSRPTVANAHAVFERLCEMKSLMHRSVAPANAMSSRSSLWPTVANAHAVFARFCELKSLMRCSAAAGSIENSRSSLWPTVANACNFF